MLLLFLGIQLVFGKVLKNGALNDFNVRVNMGIQWSLYFKTTLLTKKMWSYNYIVGGPQIKVDQIKRSYNQGWS